MLAKYLMKKDFASNEDDSLRHGIFSVTLDDILLTLTLN